MIFLALVCVGLIGLVVYVLLHSAGREREWARERQILISRIQHPETVIPPGALIPPGKIDEDLAVEGIDVFADEIDRVGTIQTGGEDGD